MVASSVGNLFSSSAHMCSYVQLVPIMNALVCLCPQPHYDTSGLPWSLCRSSSGPSARAILLVQHSSNTTRSTFPHRAHLIRLPPFPNFPPLTASPALSPSNNTRAHTHTHTHTHTQHTTHTCKPQLQPDQGSHLSKRHRQTAQNCVVGADARARNHARQRRAVALPGITKHRPARLYRCRRSEARKSGGARAAQRWEAFSLGRRQGQVQAWTLEGCLRIW